MSQDLDKRHKKTIDKIEPYAIIRLTAENDIIVNKIIMDKCVCLIL